MRRGASATQPSVLAILVTLESGSDLDDDDARERRGDALVVLANEVLDALG